DDPDVLRALRAVPRHRFVPPGLVAHAYEDRPLAIGHGQTISQPFIVGYMIAQVIVARSARVLEVGTGCGSLGSASRTSRCRWATARSAGPSARPTTRSS